MKIRISMCSEYSYRDPPIPRSRHITPAITICRELGERDVDKHVLPRDIVEAINRDSHTDILDREIARNIFGIELLEGQYLKIVLIG